ncbi:hypothetical protein IFR04_012525 [Cadophora malorum]|uniref:Uncharacterized protein n=1 Tax=Cadophora malorum TaxID=108018 RepID=A0A8H7T8B4_9HELO|nr:hypothetical protein IFR04_012525 [Cadophora malorum]
MLGGVKDYQEESGYGSPSFGIQSSTRLGIPMNRRQKEESSTFATPPCIVTHQPLFEAEEKTQHYRDNEGEEPIILWGMQKYITCVCVV